jgi:hypothetical protein
MAETKEELRAMADELAAKGEPPMEVVPAEATKEQLRQAIDAYKAQLPASSEPAEGESSKTYKVSGPYRIFGLRRGQTFEAGVKVHDDTGEAIIVVGGEWAVLKPLVEAGWIEEA